MRNFIVKIEILFLFFSFLIKFSFCLEKRVNITLNVWKGTECNFTSPVPKCRTDNLYFFLNRVFSFGTNDIVCLNIPGDIPYSIDPQELIWPHSSGISFFTKSLINYNQKLESLCNKISNSLQLTNYRLLNCQNENVINQVSIPLNTAQPFVNSPYGSNYNYTYSFNCKVYSVNSKFISPLGLVLLAIYIFLN